MDTILIVGFILIGMLIAIAVYMAGYIHGRVSRITGECIAQIIDQAIEVLHDDEPEPPSAKYRTLGSPPAGINGSRRTL